MKIDNILAKKFNFRSLLLFALPNVIMMTCLSMYNIIDGIFVSRLLDTTALSSMNMVYPAICLEMALAIMIATGGSAIVAKKSGEGKQKEAQKNLSFLVTIEIVIGLIIAIIGNLFIDEIIAFLGVSSMQAPLSITYAKIIFTFAPAFFFKLLFRPFLLLLESQQSV